MYNAVTRWERKFAPPGSRAYYKRLEAEAEQRRKDDAAPTEEQEMKSTRAEYMRQYRADKKQSETESTRLAKQIETSYREARRHIEEAMLKASPGTAVFLKHVESLA